MAIGFRGISAALAASTTDPASSPGIQSSTTTGDLMILLVGSKAATPPTCATPAGWTAPANNTVTGGTGTAGATTGGPVRITLFWKLWQSGDTDPVIDLSAAGSPTLARIISYSKGATDVWQAPICATSADTTGSTTDYTPPAATPTLDLGSGDWLGAGDMLNDDVGTATLPATTTVAGVTLGTAVNRFTSPSVAGNDGWLIAGDVPYVSGTASAGPVRSISGSGFIANFSGCSVFFQLRVLPPVERTVSATVAISVVGLVRTVPDTVAVQTVGLSRVVPVDASTGASKQRLVIADAAVSASPARVVPVDAAVQVYVTTTAPMTVALDAIVGRTVPLAGVLASFDLARAVPATADISPGWLRTVPTTLALGTVHGVTIPTSAAVQRNYPLIAETTMTFGVIAETAMTFLGDAA